MHHPGERLSWAPSWQEKADLLPLNSTSTSTSSPYPLLFFPPLRARLWACSSLCVGWGNRGVLCQAHSAARTDKCFFFSELQSPPLLPNPSEWEGGHCATQGYCKACVVGRRYRKAKSLAVSRAPPLPITPLRLPLPILFVTSTHMVTDAKSHGASDDCTHTKKQEEIHTAPDCLWHRRHLHWSPTCDRIYARDKHTHTGNTPDSDFLGSATVCSTSWR